MCGIKDGVVGALTMFSFLLYSESEKVTNERKTVRSKGLMVRMVIMMLNAYSSKNVRLCVWRQIVRSQVDVGSIHLFVYGSKHDRRHVVPVRLQLFVRVRQEMKVV